MCEPGTTSGSVISTNRWSRQSQSVSDHAWNLAVIRSTCLYVDMFRDLRIVFSPGAPYPVEVSPNPEALSNSYLVRLQPPNNGGLTVTEYDFRYRRVRWTLAWIEGCEFCWAMQSVKFNFLYYQSYFISVTFWEPVKSRRVFEKQQKLLRKDICETKKLRKEKLI